MIRQIAKSLRRYVSKIVTSGIGYRVSGIGYWVLGIGYWVSGIG